MPGDQARPAVPGPLEAGRAGPRHAAPRRSLLGRVHLPAGKAIALAAMPTAVLMGMGFTPRLAQAAEPDAPFTGDHCVSQTDSASPDASPSASDSASPSPSGSEAGAGPSSSASGQEKQAAEQSAGATPYAAASPRSPAASSPAAAGSSGSASSDPSGSTSPSPSATPSGSATAGQGLTGAVGGLLGGLVGSGSGGSATPSPSRTGTGATTAVRHALSGVTAGTAGSGTPSPYAAANQPATPSPSASPTPSATPSGTPSGSATGNPYPCPTYDAQALADADLEHTSSLLPDQPWVLLSDKLTLTGLKYEGIVKVETENGTIKDVLKFTATTVDIHNLHQIVQGPLGTQQNVVAAPGSTSTIRDGTVTMYTQELKGNLLGLIPIDFTPDSPPPLTIPSVFFTDVTVVQAGQFGGTLTIPGMHAYATG